MDLSKRQKTNQISKVTLIFILLVLNLNFGFSQSVKPTSEFTKQGLYIGILQFNQDRTFRINFEKQIYKVDENSYLLQFGYRIGKFPNQINSLKFRIRNSLNIGLNYKRSLKNHNSIMIGIGNEGYINRIGHPIIGNWFLPYTNLNFEHYFNSLRLSLRGLIQIQLDYDYDELILLSEINNLTYEKRFFIKPGIMIGYKF